MFLLIKFISNLIISPSFIIIGLLLTTLFLNKYNHKKVRRISIILLLSFYCLSIKPVSKILLNLVETKENSTTLSIQSSDAYVMLGGGIILNTPNGNIPKDAVYSRIIEVAILYKRYPKPIILSGGDVYKKGVTEASVYKKYLLNLGIPKTDIIVEEKSRTTLENARYTKDILDNINVDSITLITSASHMTRAKRTFDDLEINVSTYSSGYLKGQEDFKIIDIIPSSYYFNISFKCLWEIIGSFYYYLIKLRNIFN